MSDEILTFEKRAEQLAVRIESLIAEARKKVATVANTAQVYTYYEIGRYIVEDEQGGKIRAFQKSQTLSWKCVTSGY